MNVLSDLDLEKLFEIKQLKKRIRQLQNENVRLRALAGISRRDEKKGKCLQLLITTSLDNNAIAEAADCTTRYVRYLRRELNKITPQENTQ